MKFFLAFALNFLIFALSYFPAWAIGADIPIVIEQGESVGRTFEWKNKLDNTPVNLSGCTGALKIASKNLATVYATISSEDSNSTFVFTDRQNGKFSVLVPSTVTQALPAGTLFYEVYLVFPTTPATKWPLARGSFTVKQGL